MIGLFYCFIEAILPYLSKFYKSKLVSVLYGILEIQIKCEYTKPEEHMEKQINEKIIEIVHQANDMIPVEWDDLYICLLYTSPSPRDGATSRMPSSA